MSAPTECPSAPTTALIGIASLASAMGIGRFALTPILPLMQHDVGLTLAGGSWLAGANYLGYLVGALFCMVASPRPVSAIRVGLIGCGILTIAMGLSSAFWTWIAWRFLAGAASAFVLVGVSAWAMPILARQQKENWSGRIFSGVGAGIAFAGMIGGLAGVAHLSSQTTWIVLGLAAAIVPLLAWRSLMTKGPDDSSRPWMTEPSAKAGLPRKALIAMGCYIAFGYGYIVPATFLPTIARAHIDNATLFSWVWPAFGIAAATSTLVVEHFHASPRRLWILAQLTLTAGVVAPVFAVDMTTLLVAALCVGGSFMVITMSGIKEILRIGGAEPSRLIGMMTSGFAVGQIGGPLTVVLLPQSIDPLVGSSLIATAALLVSSCVLALGVPATPERRDDH